MMRASRSAALFAASCLLLWSCHEVMLRPDDVSPAFAVADSLRIEGRAAAASVRYRALSDSFAAAHDTASWWRATLWLSQTLLTRGNRDAGLAALATTSRLAGADADRRGWTLYVRSIFQDRVGHFDSAFVSADSARLLAVRSSDPRLEASAYHALGRIHSLSGRYHDALAANLRSLQLDNRFGASARQVSLELNELGIDYRHLGRLTDAAAAYDSALRVERRLGSPEGIARVEYNLANVRAATGDASAALTLLEDALTRAEAIGEVRGMAFIHGGIADLYLRAGALARARDHYSLALSINRSARLPYGEVQNLEGLGRVQLAQGSDSAVFTLHAALLIADSAHYGKERATVRAALARGYAAAGHVAMARRWAGEALRISDSLGDPAVQLEARAARGAALEAGGDPAASEAYLSAIALLESWRGRLAMGDLRMGVAEPHLDIYEGAIRTLLAAQHTDAAFLVAERARARALLDVLAEHEVRESPISEEARIRLALRETFEGLGDAPPQQARAAEQVIDSLSHVLDSVEASARHRAAGRVRVAAPATTAAIRTGLLRDPHQALLLYFWGEKDVYGWWLTTADLHARRLGTTAALTPQLEFLRAALSDTSGTTPWRPAASLAYQRLVAPVAPSNASRIFVVTSGPLSFVPFEAFVSSEDGTPWGATTRFAYGPSASVLLELARVQASVPGPRTLLAVGDPSTASSSRNVGAVAARASSSPLPDLPAAALEARRVAELMNGDVLIGAAATRKQWLARDPGRYRFLHFATHAVLDDEAPQHSALLLADGALDVQQIRRLRLSADVVTLSACETGIGPQLASEGIIGLPHAFIEAGAHAVIVSLWRVRDPDAAQYMVDFYRGIRRGLSPEDAMLAVRRSRLRSTTTQSPAQWAAFVMIGTTPGVSEAGGH
jgi:CHAT domain-containing protein/tetratricopeptide (TPR) repeat protein